MDHTSGGWDWPRLRVICEREARRILRSAADVDDVVQAAMELVASSRPLRGQGAPHRARRALSVALAE